MTKKLLLALTSALVALASPQPAFSFDYKIHPGSLCQPSKGDEAVNFIRGPGFIYHTNVLAGRLFVNCPIIRDRVPHLTGPDERTAIDAGIHLNYLGKENEIECRFFAMRENGSAVTGGGLVPTQIVNDPVQQVLSLFWAVKPNETALDGSYSINCQIPAYVFVLRFVVGEEKSTDDGGV